MNAALSMFLRLGAATLLSAASAFAYAQTYPSKPIQLVIPYAVGGGVDTTARQLANHFSKALGQSVIVDARPGGATVIGTGYAARAEPDGYTLLLTGGSTMSLQPLTFEGTLPFDPLKDFAPVGMISRIPLFLAVASNTPYKTLQDLIDDAKRRPGAISYASNGLGSLSHLGAEILSERAGIELNHIPYKGFAPAIPDLATGRVSMMMSDLAGLSSSLQADSVRLLGASGKDRSPFQKEVPTIAESGFPDYEVEVWLALFAPAGTPEEIMTRLREELRTFLTLPETREALGKLGHEADPSDGQEVEQRIVREQKMFAPIVEKAGIKGK